MAIARPVRAVLVLALILCGFFILRTFWSEPEVKPPPKYPDGQKPPIRKGADGVDPNWERTYAHIPNISTC